MDEVFEVLTLIQTQKISPMPIVFIGREYWQPLFGVVKGMVTAGTISVAEMDRISRLMLVTDNISEMITHLKVHIHSLADNGFSAPNKLCHQIAIRQRSKSPNRYDIVRNENATE
jgi:predicted Rossmann-fold nucleotide-binding protein